MVGNTGSALNGLDDPYAVSGPQDYARQDYCITARRGAGRQQRAARHGRCHGGVGASCLLYIDWLAKQFLPDTAETEWLDRHAQIWLVNADGTLGRKQATLASGRVTVTGVNGLVLPKGVQLIGQNVTYETTEQVVVGTTATPVAITAVDAGSIGNQNEGDTIAFVTAIAGFDAVATVVELTGGSDAETDDELRDRVLAAHSQSADGRLPERLYHVGFGRARCNACVGGAGDGHGDGHCAVHV